MSRKDPDGSMVYFQSLGSVGREFRLDSSENLVYDYYNIYDSETGDSVFMDATEAAIARFNNVKYDENVNKIGYSSTAILGQNFKYGSSKKYREGSSDPRIKWGTIKFGTGGIQYASSPGVLSSRQSYNKDTGETTFTDPYGNIFRYGKIENGSAVYYPNNTLTERTFDEHGRLEAIAHKRQEPNGTTTTLESFSYQYDDTGNITKITQANGEYIDYNYDNLNRLTEEHRKTTAGTTIYKIEYLFDNNDAKNGNIHQVVVNDVDTTTFAYNEMNELTGITHPDTSTETLTYDDNGNLVQMVNNTTGETTILEWTIFNDLSKIIFSDGHSIENQYNADGQITGQKAFSEQRTFTQKNWNIAREEISVNDTEKLADKIYTIKPDGEILSVTHKGEPFYLHTDHLGTAHFLTDKYGNKITTGLYTGYGNSLPLEKNGTPGAKENRGAMNINTLGYVAALGIRNEFQMKMQYMRSRFYSALYRRFVSVDKKRDGNNYYSYTDSNPIRYADPFGYSTTFYVNPLMQSSSGQEKREDILSTLYNKYNGRRQSLNRQLRCGEMIEYLSDAINELLKLDCIWMKDFVDIFGLLNVVELPVPNNDAKTIIATMYQARSGEAKRLQKKYFLYGAWTYEDFWDNYKDSHGEVSDQVHHYLAYVFITFASNFKICGDVSAYFHDLTTGNEGDIKLGLLGSKVGKFLLSVRNSCMGQNENGKKRKECLKKNKKKILMKFGEACVKGTYERFTE